MKKDFNAAREGWDGVSGNAASERKGVIAKEGTGACIRSGSTETLITREGTGACITLKV